jgi:hypothetical protein
LAGQTSPQPIHEVRGKIKVRQGKSSQRRFKVDKVPFVSFGQNTQGARDLQVSALRFNTPGPIVDQQTV